MAFVRDVVFLLCLFLHVLAFYGAFCSKILVLPGVSTGSHFLYMSKIGENLAQAGHDVTLLLGENHNDLKKTPLAQELFTFEKYHTAMDKTLFRNFDSLFMSKALKGHFEVKDLTIMLNGLYEDCNEILRDKDLLERLRYANFDIIIANHFAMCTTIIAQKLDKPFVITSTNKPFSPVDAYYINMPSPISYVPSMMSVLSDRMSFMQRVQNTIVSIAGYTLSNFIILPRYDELKQTYGIKSEMSMFESLGSAELYLFAVDWAFEFPRPIMPNTVFIGGLMAKEAAPLDSEWEDFVNSADDGIVVFSFGSMANPGSNMEVAEMLTAALARLPQKVVMRYEGQTPKNLGNNTKLVKWMPQNDLLGHPKTKAFVSHGGMNGIYEAIYHGVPMVGLPLYGDQFDNFVRLTAKGMAVSVNIGTLTSDELYEAITTVVNNPSYKENAMQLARIHRDTPMSPGDTAVFWIEHVIKHGGQHLRAEAFNLNIFQYFLLDVMAFLLLVCIIIIVMIKAMFTCLCKLCCKQKEIKEKVN